MFRSSAGRIALAAAVTLVMCLRSTGACGEDGVVRRSNPRRFRCRVDIRVTDMWKERYGILLCLVHPESDAFQDVDMINHTPGVVTAIPGMGGDKYLRLFFAPDKLDIHAPVPDWPEEQEEKLSRKERKSRQKAPGPKPILSVYQEFFVTLYDIETDFDQITHLYPYDTESELYQAYTALTLPYIDPDHETIRAVVEEIRSQVENDLDFIQLAFRYAKNEVRRGASEGRQPLAQTLRRGGSGGNISAVFVSLLRCGGIPARMAVAKRIDGQSRVWAEFYLEKYGWIPADPSIQVQGDTFFGRISPPRQKGRSSRSQIPSIILNHVYGEFEVPIPLDNAHPMKANFLRDFLVWGVHTKPQYSMKIKEVEALPGFGGSSSPMKNLKLPLR